MGILKTQSTKQVINDLVKKVLPAKNEFFESSKIKALRKLKKFNRNSCLNAGLYIHFKPIGESKLIKWTHVTIDGEDGPIVLEKVADANGYRQDVNTAVLQGYLKSKKSETCIQGNLFA